MCFTRGATAGVMQVGQFIDRWNTRETQEKSPKIQKVLIWRSKLFDQACHNIIFNKRTTAGTAVYHHFKVPSGSMGGKVLTHIFQLGTEVNISTWQGSFKRATERTCRDGAGVIGSSWTAGLGNKTTYRQFCFLLSNNGSSTAEKPQFSRI